MQAAVGNVIECNSQTNNHKFDAQVAAISASAHLKYYNILYAKRLQQCKGTKRQ